MTVGGGRKVVAGEGDSTSQLEELSARALLAAQRAHAPQSGFHVGAALLDDRGSIYAGCNVETTAHTAVHAEEAAVAAWKLGGGGRILLIVVRNAAGESIPPCGMCRQLLQEMAPGASVEMRGSLMTVEELLPSGFGERYLQADSGL